MKHAHSAERANRRPLVLLLLGAMVGMLAAAGGLLSGGASEDGPLPAHAVARVNGQLIHWADYQRALQSLATDRRGPIDAEQRQFVLDRLVDEELLIQRGLELGLAQHDARVRKDLTLAMVDSVIAEYRDLDASDPELQSFFSENREFFSQVGRFRVRQVWMHARSLADGDAAFERAREAAERLRRGEAFDRVRDSLGDEESPPLPDALLPPNKLADYLGPTVLRAALELDVGEISEPIRSSTGYHVVQLVERGASETPEFNLIRTHVLTEYRRRQADNALREYLAELRDRADLEVASDLEQGIEP